MPTDLRTKRYQGYSDAVIAVHAVERENRKETRRHRIAEIYPV